MVDLAKLEDIANRCVEADLDPATILSVARTLQECGCNPQLLLETATHAHYSGVEPTGELLAAANSQREYLQQVFPNEPEAPRRDLAARLVAQLRWMSWTILAPIPRPHAPPRER